MVESNIADSLFLLCDEELPFLSTPGASPMTEGSCTGMHQPLDASFSSPAMVPSSSVDVHDEEREGYVKDCLRRESQYAPLRGYSDVLKNSPFLSAARLRAVKYIILACNRLNLALGTAFNAVNYLDRFISLNCTVTWERWMMELLSIACLSIASKLDEVSIPPLHDLQIEDHDHTFQSIAIQQMELTVLKALDWRLSCITPYSYVADLVRWNHTNVNLDSFHFHSSLLGPITELLVCALPDIKMLEFGASTIAASALRCAAGAADSTDISNIVFNDLIPVHDMNAVGQCVKIMSDAAAAARCDGRLYSKERCSDQSSPDSVLGPVQSASHSVLGIAQSDPKCKIKKRQREGGCIMGRSRQMID